MRMPKIFSKRTIKGMTMVELMIVMVIIGMLVSMGVPGYIRLRNKSNKKSCELNLTKIKAAADQCRLDRNISYNEYLDIVRLWSTDAEYQSWIASSGNDTVLYNSKNSTKYIAKRPRCPKRFTTYVGNIRWVDRIYRSRMYVYADTSNANGKNMVGGPFCVETDTAGTTVLGPPAKITGKGTYYSHYITNYVDPSGLWDGNH